MRGKTWTFVRPRDAEKVIRFEATGETFGAKYKAQGWLRDHGYRYGSTSVPCPFVAAMKGEHYTLPQKLYNFSQDDYMQVGAVMYSYDYRDGWVEVWLVEPMIILDLVLKHQWYDMIVSGEKREEYRDRDKWLRRIRSKPYTHVRFRRGYTGTAAIYRIDGIAIGTGRPDWGAPADTPVIIIRIGEKY